MFFHIGNATGADYKGFVFDNKRRKNINKQEKETSQLGFKFKNLFMSQVGNLLNLC